MQGKLKDLKTVSRLLVHRVIRPRIWRTVLRRLEAVRSDQSFLRRFRFSGTTEEFIDRFHSRLRLRFFFHPRNRKDFFLNLLTHTQPYEQLLAEADDVLENRFDTLGSGKVSLGERINWHRDFKSGREWPVRTLSTDEILDLSNSSDVKVPWELSRFHQVWWLGKAYWLTRNERYAEKFGELVLDWIEKNPPGKGINWTVAMESAIRSCNWIAGYYVFCESRSLSTGFWMRFLKSLYGHGVFIENNLEYSWRSGNHLLANIVGLIFLGFFFRDTPSGRRWLRGGTEKLQEEMQTQVYPDGVSYEKAIGYHRLVLELFYTAAILCLRNKVGLSPPFMERLEKMFEFVQHYSRPDGCVPLVGDADDGRLFRFSMQADPNDHRHALSVGAVLFRRADFKASAGLFSQDAVWLFGGEGFETFQILGQEEPTVASRMFGHGGFAVMRSRRAHLFVDTGDIGMKGRGGHGHNDTLSFELWTDGAPLIVDSGTYCYTSDLDVRREFRSTRAHNTILIDGRELAEFKGLWSVKEDRTNPRVLEWSTSPERDVLEAEHSAYQTLPVPVLVRRRFEFSKAVTQVIIADFVSGAKSHLIESFFHLHPKVLIESLDARQALLTLEGRRYVISATSGEFAIIESRYSKSYGVAEPNRTLRLSLRARSALIITTIMGYD